MAMQCLIRQGSAMLNKLFGQSKVATHSVQVEAQGPIIEVEKGEVLLDALLRQKVDVPYSCQAGSCGECKCRLMSGSVKELLDSAYVLDRSEIEQGYILACQSVLKNDICISYSGE